VWAGKTARSRGKKFDRGGSVWDRNFKFRGRSGKTSGLRNFNYQRNTEYLYRKETAKQCRTIRHKAPSQKKRTSLRCAHRPRISLATFSLILTAPSIYPLYTLSNTHSSPCLQSKSHQHSPSKRAHTSPTHPAAQLLYGHISTTPSDPTSSAQTPYHSSLWVQK
jgi:hypothetical protein